MSRNLTIDDHHWRQRVKLEIEAARYNSNPSKGGLSIDSSWDELHRTSRELSPMRPLMQRLGQSAELPVRSTFASRSLTARLPVIAGVGPESKSASKSGIARNRGGTAAGPSSGVESASESKTRSGGKPESKARNGPLSRSLPLPSADNDAGMYLTYEQAYLANSHKIHLVGCSTAVDGLDPADKYRFPQTASQQIGWRVRAPLEIDSKHFAKRSLTLDKLYG